MNGAPCQLAVADFAASGAAHAACFAGGIRREIVMEDETIVKLTENHMLKTINGWKKAKDIIEDDEILSW